MSDQKKQFEMQMYNQFWNNVRRAEASSWQVFLSYSLFIGIITFLFENDMPNWILVILIIIFTTLAITMSLSANVWFVRNMYLISRVEKQFEPYNIIPKTWIPLDIKFFNKELYLIHTVFYFFIGLFLCIFFLFKNIIVCIENIFIFLTLIITLIISIVLLYYYINEQLSHFSDLKNSFICDKNERYKNGNLLKKISIDVDSILIDIMVNYCKIYNKKKNSKKTKEDVTDWDFFDDWGLSKEEGRGIFENIDLQDVPVISDTLDCYLLLLNQRSKVDIVTNRKEEQRKALLKKFKSMNLKPGIQYQNLIIVDSEKKKLDLDYDIYIDDSPKLANIIEKYPNKILILLDQPWNKNIQIANNIKRVNNWKEIYDEIIKLLL